MSHNLQATGLRSLYAPVVSLIESDFNAPILWYFKSCGYELLLIGDDPKPSLSVTLTYVAVLSALFGSAAYPVMRKIRHRFSAGVTAKQSAQYAR